LFSFAFLICAVFAFVSEHKKCVQLELMEEVQSFPDFFINSLIFVWVYPSNVPLMKKTCFSLSSISTSSSSSSCSSSYETVSSASSDDDFFGASFFFFCCFWSFFNSNFFNDFFFLNRNLFINGLFLLFKQFCLFGLIFLSLFS